MSEPQPVFDDMWLKCARAACWAKCQNINPVDALRNGCKGPTTCWRWEENVSGTRAVIETLMEPSASLKDKLIALGIDKADWQTALNSVLEGGAPVPGAQ